MRGYILLSHGSKLSSSNNASFEIFYKLQNKIENLEIAFLELAKPDFRDAIVALSNKNIEKITVLPLFLTPGKHVKNDIPAQAKKLEDEFGIAIEVLEHIGARDEYISIIELILNS